VCEVKIEPPTPRRMVWRITFLNSSAYK